MNKINILRKETDDIILRVVLLAILFCMGVFYLTINYADIENKEELDSISKNRIGTVLTKNEINSFKHSLIYKDKNLYILEVKIDESFLWKANYYINLDSNFVILGIYQDK